MELPKDDFCRRRPVVYLKKGALFLGKHIFLVCFFLIAFYPSFGRSNIRHRPTFTGDSSKNVFIRIVPSKSTVYAGEAFTIKYLLYSAVHVIDPQNHLEFNFKDSYWEEYPDQEQEDSTLINGKLFHSVLLKKLVVIAKNPGAFIIPAVSITLKMDAPPDANSFFGDDKLVTKKVLSDAKTINVLPLPPMTSPDFFSGAVGNFIVSGGYTATKQNPKVLKFQLTVSGTGDLKLARFKTPVLPYGIDAFDENNSEIHSLTDNGIDVKHSYSVTLIANYKGSYDIAPITFSSFNIATNRYEIFSVPHHKWNVAVGAPIPHDVLNAKNAISANPKEYLITKSGLSGSWKDRLFFGSGYFYILLGAGIFVFIAGGLYAYQLKSKKINRAFYFYKGAAKRARKSLKKLNSMSPTINEDTFSKNLIHILQNYLSDRNLIRHDDFSGTGLDLSLLDSNVPPLLKEQVFSFINKHYTIRFSVGRNSNVNRDDNCLALLQISTLR